MTIPSFYFSFQRTQHSRPCFSPTTAFQNGNKLRINSIFLASHSLWVRTAPVNLKPRQMVIYLWQSVQMLKPCSGITVSQQGERGYLQRLKRTLRCGASPGAQQSPTHCRCHSCHSLGGWRLGNCVYGRNATVGLGENTGAGTSPGSCPDEDPRWAEWTRLDSLPQERDLENTLEYISKYVEDSP